MTTQEVARELGVPPSRLNQFISQGSLPEPTRIGRAFYWTDQDVANARQLLRAISDYRQQRARLGVYGKGEAE